MKTRILHTRFWKDSYIRKLTAGEKLIYIYLITNEKVNIIHCYELDIDEIVFDVGLAKANILQALAKFQKDGKIAYARGWLFLGNAMKYEEYKGPKNEKAKRQLLQEMSKPVLDWYNNVCDRGIIGVYIPPINHKSKYINNKERVVKGKQELDNKEFIEELVAMFPYVNVSSEIEKMKDWLSANGKTKDDYKAFARNWLRNTKPEKERIAKIR